MNEDLRVLSNGINEVIKSYDFIDELEKGSNTDWTTNLRNLVKKNFAWVNNYLRGEDAQNMQYELLTDAFIKVFLERADKVFSSYIPKGQEGHRSKMEAYIHFILDRATQEISKAQYKRYKKNYEDTISVNPYDNESNEDAFDRITQNVDLPISDQIIFENLVDKLKMVMSDKGSFAGDLQVLVYLIEGYSKSEIANMLGIAPSRVSARIKSIKEDLEELAIYFSHKGDDSLLKLINKYKLLTIDGTSENAKVLKGANADNISDLIDDDTIDEIESNMDKIFYDI